MNEPEYAKQMLNSRDHGVSLSLSLIKMKGRLLFRLFILIISLTAYYLLSDAPIFLIIVGIAIGTTLQDIGWLQSISKSWPLINKVTNWDAVSDIAENDS